MIISVIQIIAAPTVVATCVAAICDLYNSHKR